MKAGEKVNGFSIAPYALRSMLDDFLLCEINVFHFEQEENDFNKKMEKC